MNNKVGIITIHFPYNYGAMLQAYATQRFLDNNDIENEIIDFRPYEIDKDYHIRIETLKKNLNLFLHMCLSKLLGKRKKYHNFEKFLAKDMKLSAKTYKKIDAKTQLKYDILIAGSDQIWNPDIMQKRYEYILKVGQEKKKISYASSFGKDEIDEESKKIFKEELKKYSAISTREQQGIEILKNMGISKGVKVCDPVFLLSKQEWDDVKQNEIKIDGKYVLLYSLQNNDVMNESIVKVSKEYGYKIVSVHPTGVQKDFADINVSNVGPKGFIDLIDNAEFVFSNSFHATAFSIIYNKKIFAFLHSKTGSRVKNMLEQFEMMQKKDDKTGDYYYCRSAQTEQSIEKLVDISKKYLLNAL